METLNKEKKRQQSRATVRISVRGPIIHLSIGRGCKFNIMDILEGQLCPYNDELYNFRINLHHILNKKHEHGD